MPRIRSPQPPQENCSQTKTNVFSLFSWISISFCSDISGKLFPSENHRRSESRLSKLCRWNIVLSLLCWKTNRKTLTKRKKRRKILDRSNMIALDRKKRLTVETFFVLRWNEFSPLQQEAFQFYDRDFSSSGSFRGRTVEKVLMNRRSVTIFKWLQQISALRRIKNLSVTLNDLMKIELTLIFLVELIFFYFFLEKNFKTISFEPEKPKNKAGRFSN